MAEEVWKDIPHYEGRYLISNQGRVFSLLTKKYRKVQQDIHGYLVVGLTDINYSRYNHNSAVRTINSLPDTSAYLATAGGTNTIKFEGQSGASTDGGAINTLTEEEIAVATAKGWSVALV